MWDLLIVPLLHPLQIVGFTYFFVVAGIVLVPLW